MRRTFDFGPRPAKKDSIVPQLSLAVLIYIMWWNYRKIYCWTTGHRTTFWSDIVHICSIFVPNFQFLSRTANWDLQNFAYESILVPNSDCLSPIWIAGITTKASTWNQKWKKYTDVAPALITWMVNRGVDRIRGGGEAGNSVVQIGLIDLPNSGGTVWVTNIGPTFRPNISG